VPQDGGFELAELGRRRHPDLLGEPAAVPLERTERLDLTTGPVERQDLQHDEALAQRVRLDDLGQLGHRGRVAARGEIGLEALLQRREPELGQAGALGRHEVDAGKIGEDLAPPDVQGGGEVALRQQPLEAAGVERVVVDVEHVARSRRAQDRRLQRPS
jgi:hypothetical protein